MSVVAKLENALLAELSGRVVETVGQVIAIAGMPAPVGAVVEIDRGQRDPLPVEIVGFRDDRTLAMPLAAPTGVRRGSAARLVQTTRSIGVGAGLLGRVVNALGETIDGRSQPFLRERRPLQPPPIAAVQRPRIDEPLGSGVRAIDAMLTCGRGQRLGIFAGSGVGKSVLVGMMARYTAADVAVIGLIGERGREVNEFIQRELGPEGLARSVIVAATSDEPALLRVQAAYAATAIAEHFRDEGRDVLLVMDSITRFALAQREIGLAAGEPPATRGFPPSTFALLPRLVERAGRTQRGSITGFYSVLVEGDDENEPIADSVRGLLDGHVWLSRRLAERGHYPAIDVLRSISRLSNDLSAPSQRQARGVIRDLLSNYSENEDLVTIGAYRRGANRTLDAAVEMRGEINALLQQQVDDHATLENSLAALENLAVKCQTRLNSAPTAGNAATPTVGGLPAAT